MSLAAAAEPPPGSPWWVYVLTTVAGVLIAYVAARSPVWVEKAKRRIGKTPDPPPALEKAGAAAASASGEVVLREWLRSVERKNRRLEQRVDDLESELYRRGWDGRLP